MKIHNIQTAATLIETAFLHYYFCRISHLKL